tara:strand:- start:3495 stop:3797 length:303 start_codon:yes stop_codon:yes gene_type:complete
MSTLIEVQKKGRFNVLYNEVEFIADYENYQISGTIECDIELDEMEDYLLGIRDSYQLDGVTFWDIKIIDEMSVEISLSKELEKEWKQDVENYFDNLTQEL